jgi:hypothetical protein
MNESEDQLRDNNWLFYSCYHKLNRVVEQFVQEHVFTHILEGSLDFFLGTSHHVYHEGDMLLIKRNQLAKVVKLPSAGGMFRSYSLYLDQPTLRAMSLEYSLKADAPYRGDNIVPLKQDAFYKSFAESLIPYMEARPEQVDPALAQLKVREVVLLMLRLNKQVKNLLKIFYLISRSLARSIWRNL